MKLQDLDLTKTYTYADYLQWRFDEMVELIKGKVFKMSPAPSSHHQEVSGKLLLRIGYFFEARNCKVFHAPFDVRFYLPGGGREDEQIETVLQPDISVICDLEKIDARGCLGAPDWIIEIASPSTADKDMKYKFEVYEATGVKEYWMVLPLEKQVLVYYLNEKGRYIGLPPYIREDTISPVLFPDLKIELKEVFPEAPILKEPEWGKGYVRM